MLKTTAPTPRWPNEKFCAVGGFWTRNDPTQFQNTVFAPAHPMLMSFQNLAVSGASMLSYSPPVAHCSCGSLDENGLVALQSRKTFPLAVGWPIMNECRPLSEWHRCTNASCPRRANVKRRAPIRREIGSRETQSCTV